MWSRLTSIALVAALICAAGSLFAQSPPNPEAAEGQVTLTELFPPAYPPLARQTRIVGDVQLELKIRQDGSVDSLEVASGHPLLAPAALDSAKQSHFRCTNCSESLTSYRLVYTFQFVDTEDCCSTTLAGLPKPSQSENRITVFTRPMCLCDPAGTTTKVRSIKCLYLWHCSVRYPL
jgi:TonB family protein